MDRQFLLSIKMTTPIELVTALAERLSNAEIAPSGNLLRLKTTVGDIEGTPFRVERNSDEAWALLHCQPSPTQGEAQVAIVALSQVKSAIILFPHSLTTLLTGKENPRLQPGQAPSRLEVERAAKALNDSLSPAPTLTILWNGQETNELLRLIALETLNSLKTLISGWKQDPLGLQSLSTLQKITILPHHQGGVEVRRKEGELELYLGPQVLLATITNELKTHIESKL